MPTKAHAEYLKKVAKALTKNKGAAGKAIVPNSQDPAAVGRNLAHFASCTSAAIYARILGNIGEAMALEQMAHIAYTKLPSGAARDLAEELENGGRPVKIAAR